MRCSRSTRVVAATVVGLLAACAAPPGPPRPPPAHPPDRPACPLGVDGASVSAEETATGIAVVVMAREDDVAEIRERAHDAAKLHGPFGRVGRGHDGRHGLGGQHGLRALVLPPARAAARDIEGGARIEIEPLHSRDREALRDRVRERVAFMSTSACDVDPRKETP